MEYVFKKEASEKGARQVVTIAVVALVSVVIWVMSETWAAAHSICGQWEDKSDVHTECMLRHGLQ